MARYIGSVCKLCRREGMKLFFKSDRCYTDKCSFERKSYAPGQHGQSRSKVSEYALQLREKQKVKRVYGLMESQFKKTFREADRLKGVTGGNLISLLESRLDNVVYRLGFAGNRAEARIMTTHGHFVVNGRKVNIPSYVVKPDDRVDVAEKKKKSLKIAENIKGVERRGIPEWLSLDREKLSGSVLRSPVRDDVTFPINELLIVELYSK
ncbi:MAG: 30S ribosomal protein S4 [Thermodesulfobacteriota bacterium]|nr:MAG: 30S ribosomal protein S4 [Thermodesulfobacteriota bacterium]